MKLLLHIIIILFLSYLLSLYFPWWVFAIIAFASSFFIKNKEGASFLAGFIAILVLWGAMAFFLNQQNEGILATKVGELLGGLTPNLLILATAFIGALIGGLAAWSGAIGAKLVAK